MKRQNSVRSSLFPSETNNSFSSSRQLLSCKPDGDDCHHVKTESTQLVQNKDTCGVERLKRQREEVASDVVIPETWGQEDFLKDWIDCSCFDKSLAPDGIASARRALIAASTSHLRINN